MPRSSSMTSPPPRAAGRPLPLARTGLRPARGAFVARLEGLAALAGAAYGESVGILKPRSGCLRHRELSSCVDAGERADVADLTSTPTATRTRGLPLRRSFQAGGQPGYAQIGGRWECPWMTVGDRGFPFVLAQVRWRTSFRRPEIVGPGNKHNGDEAPRPKRSDQGKSSRIAGPFSILAYSAVVPLAGFEPAIRDRSQLARLVRVPISPQGP